MTDTPPADAKSVLHRYLRTARDTLLWKLDGLSEYDLRRPLTPTATNLLGLVKHITGCEIGYFADTFGRPFPDTPDWLYDDDSEPNVEMWARAEESSAEIVDRYRRACAHADETIAALDIDSIGHVPHWPAPRDKVTLHTILVHMLAETNRHAGHADIVRELIDGTAGLRVGVTNMPEEDSDWWVAYRDRVEKAAVEAGRD
ncbi:MAG TPA: DinB family protein [Pseudonocardiaceae bacterium]